MSEIVKLEANEADFFFFPEEILRVQVISLKEIVIISLPFILVFGNGLISSILPGGTIPMLVPIVVAGMFAAQFSIYWLVPKYLGIRRRKALSELTIEELRARESTRRIDWTDVKQIRLTSKRLTIVRSNARKMNIVLVKAVPPALRERVASLAQGKLLQK